MAYLSTGACSDLEECPDLVVVCQSIEEVGHTSLVAEGESKAAQRVGQGTWAIRKEQWRAFVASQKAAVSSRWVEGSYLVTVSFLEVRAAFDALASPTSPVAVSA